MLQSLLGRSEIKATKSPTDPFWYSSFVSPSSTGKVVNNDTAMSVAAVYACVRVLAEAVAALPLKLYRRRADGGKEVAQSHWLYRVLHDQPNPLNTSMEFWEFAMYCLCLRGNSYAEIVGNGDSLVPIHPDAMLEVRKVGSMDLAYDIRTESGDKRTIMKEDMLHIRGLSADNILGLSPITVLRNAIGLALSAEEFGAVLFKNGVRPSGVMEHPSKLSPEAFQRLQQSQQQHAGSANAHKTLILEEGMTWKPVTMTNEDAQFIELRKLQVEEIARAYRIPLHMLQMMDRATFSNIEHMGIEFVVHTLRPWLVRIERAIRRDLLPQENAFFAEFLVDGLLRGDTRSRYEAYGLLIDRTVLSPNEVRLMENMNPREGGDVYVNPNTTTYGEDGAENNHEGQEDEQKQARKQHRNGWEPNAVGAVSIGFARDIAGRMAARELKEIEKHAKHQKADPGRFSEWAATFYKQQAECVDQMLSTFCDVHHVRTIDRINAIEKLTANRCAALVGGNAEQLVSEWKTTLAEDHAATIMELVS